MKETKDKKNSNDNQNNNESDDLNQSNDLNDKNNKILKSKDLTQIWELIKKEPKKVFHSRFIYPIDKNYIKLPGERKELSIKMSNIALKVIQYCLIISILFYLLAIAFALTPKTHNLYGFKPDGSFHHLKAETKQQYLKQHHRKQQYKKEQHKNQQNKKSVKNQSKNNQNKNNSQNNKK